MIVVKFQTLQLGDVHECDPFQWSEAMARKIKDNKSAKINRPEVFKYGLILVDLGH